MLLSAYRNLAIRSLFASILPFTAYAGVYNADIVNYANNSFSHCAIAADGTLDNCDSYITSGSNALLHGPSSLKFYGEYVYVTNSDDNSYVQCPVKNSEIYYTDCKRFSPSGAGALNKPSGIAFKGEYAYITNMGNGTYTRCNLDDNGINSSSCQTISTGAATNSDPAAMSFIGDKAYIVNFYNNSYTQCQVNNDVIDSTSCENITPSGSGALNGPTGIIINEVFNGSTYRTYAYITNLNNSSYTQCQINDNVLDPTSCKTTVLSGGGALDDPSTIAITNGYIYITNINSHSYTQCLIGYDGIESSTCKTNMSVTNYFMSVSGLDFT
ncbi:MAG: hypothetical protein KBD37_04645 [Burkholderiales bacterium]|nr:hypothetical protein [Burkholderiales bacterium]